ncbi:hypothetical protein [Aquincola sp. J276]|uniref:hypothetical protein n=1 Tax=Aquincola sp. J276 TaxID=2898432 RepID=UPI0021509398|nr:hypothetical protein [Aquincola sp. J276]MCR5868077.1 hypothetical protein [Aquincola sp. J276]
MDPQPDKQPSKPTSQGPARNLQGAVDFTRWLAEARAGKHIDPYAAWALQTLFRQFFKSGEVTPVLDFLVELKGAPPDAVDFISLLNLQELGASVPPVYCRPMPGSLRLARHVTVRIDSRTGDMRELGEQVLNLMVHPAVKRVQIGFPRPRANQPAQAVKRPDQLPKPGHPPAEPPPPPPPPVLIGVLDDGCPFAHAALRKEGGGTRVQCLWDQTSRIDDATDLDDPPPPDFLYGRQRTASSLDTIALAHTHGGHVEEEAVYQDPRALQAQPLSRMTHAAAVIGLLAGRPSRLPVHTTTAALQAAGDDGVPFRREDADDAAATAPLAVVQFPREQVNVGGSRWMVVRALDGLRYLANASQALAPEGDPPIPLVANLSYGGVTSAHDGTALLETAMDELAGAHPAMAIVLAAGNSYGTARVLDSPDALQRRPGGRHFEHLGLRHGQSTELRLLVPPHKPIETYLEIWFDRDDDPQGGFVGEHEIAITARSPLGQVLKVERWPSVAFNPPRAEATTAGLLCFPRVAQSLKHSMALLVVAATRMSTTRVEVGSGEWSIVITHQGTDQAAPWNVRAWVERDVIPGQTARLQAARLLAPHGGPGRLTDEDTLNSAGTGWLTVRAGALTAQLDAGGKPMASLYSASVRPGERPLEISAMADESLSQPGIRVCGTTSDATVRANGTSLAAPQAARWIVNQLAAHRTAKHAAAAAAPAVSVVPTLSCVPGVPAAPVTDLRRGRLLL